MAGQPQEPSWQPNGQEQTRVAPAWPQPTYTPPTGSPHDGYAYPQQPDVTQPGMPVLSGQPVPAAQPGQPAQPPYGHPGFGQPVPPAQPAGHGQPGQQGQPGQAQPHWQAIAGMTAAPDDRYQQAKPKGGKGFLGSLFDFTFTNFVTPKIIKALYALFTIWTVIWAIIFLRLGFHYGTAAGIFVLVVVEPVFILLTLGVCRVVLEAFMVAFRIYEETKRLREHAERQG